MKPRKLLVFLPAVFTIYVTVQMFYRSINQLGINNLYHQPPPDVDTTLDRNDENFRDDIRIHRAAWHVKSIAPNLNLLKKKLLLSTKNDKLELVPSSNTALLSAVADNAYPVRDLYSREYGSTRVLTTTMPPEKRDFIKTSSSYCRTTLVTSMMDIGRGGWLHYGRPYELYKNYVKSLLQLDVCLYIFTDEATEGYLRDQRKSYMDKTFIKVVSLKDLPYSLHYTAIKDIVDQEQATWNKDWEPAMRTHPESFSADYLLLMNSKAYFVSHASEENFFHSTHFFWMDAGYGHGRHIYPRPGTQWEPKGLLDGSLKDRVTFIKLADIDFAGRDKDHLKLLYRQDVALIVGSFFGGTAHSVQQFYSLYDSVFLDLLKKRHVDDDQTLIVLCYHKKSELFNFVDGDWYDVFKLFS